MAIKLVVLGIPWDVDTEGLKQYMSKFGKLDDCIVMKVAIDSELHSMMLFLVQHVTWILQLSLWRPYAQLWKALRELRF